MLVVQKVVMVAVMATPADLYDNQLTYDIFLMVVGDIGDQGKIKVSRSKSSKNIVTK